MIAIWTSAVLITAGCQSSDDADQQGQASRYEVVEEEDASSADTSASKPSSESAAPKSRQQSSPELAANSPASSRSDSPTAKPDRPAMSAGASAAPGATGRSSTPSQPSSGRTSRSSVASTDSASAPSKPPPSKSPSELNSYEVPDGTPEQLLDFIRSIDGSIQQIASTMIEPSQRALARERIRQALLAKEKAGGKAYAESDDRQIKYQAAQAKLEAQLGLVGMGDRSVTQRVVAFAKVLENAGDPRLVQNGRQLLISIEVGKLSMGGQIDLSQLLKSFETLFREGTPDPAMVDAVQNTVAVLNQTGNIETALKLLEMASLSLAKSDNPEIANIGQAFGQQVAIQKLSFPEKVAAVARNQTPETERAFMDALKAIEQMPQPGEAILFNLVQALRPLEEEGRFDLVRTTCDMILRVFGGHPNPQVQTAAKQETQDVLTRINLIGKPLSVEGLAVVSGQPLDFNAYRGKIVLVEFWVAGIPGWERQVPEFRKIYEEYHPLGLEIIGINLDRDRSAAQAAFKRLSLPWTIAYSVDPNRCLVAEQWRVQSIPFSILVDRDGIAVALHLSPEDLRRYLEQHLKKPSSAQEPPPSNTPKKGTPNTDSNGKSSSPAGGEKSDGKTSQRRRPEHPSRLWQSTWYVTTAPTATGDEDEPESTAQQSTKDDSSTSPLPEADGNPYAAPDNASAKELTAYLLEMADKPKSIRARRLFKEAMVDAAARLLEQPRHDRDKRLAATTLFETLDDLAFDGDRAADQRLFELATALSKDSHAAIARQAKFHLLKHRALSSADLKQQEVEQLLDDLFDVMTQLESLDGRHLRGASATVRAINQLEDDKVREAQFQRFGKLFAQSSDLELKRYGRKLAHAEQAAGEWVGKELILDGNDDLGTPFQWKSYRGKLVVVDFWATWCGPCRREMPHLKQLYQQWHDKGLEVVGVNLDKDSDALAKYLKENPVPWSQLVGEGAREAAQRYGVRSIPTMMLVDEQGKIIAMAHQVSKLAPQIEQRLGRK